jgi:peptidoglycan/LPS O-acetylase OafA/YrhL
VETLTLENRYLSRGDEVGTAPGDRRFRPDVEGLRAVAVALVVLYHANIPGLTGGYVGVDVFFVISGFVITGLLLRERATTGRTSILEFYGRRCRRIIPAATLVIVVTVVASYQVLGVLGGGRAAVDGRWAAIFLANFHFSSVGTNYLTASLPPSPLQNFWSLSVEEQFYLVYPTLFLLAALVPSRFSLRARLTSGLTVVIVASFALSVVQTSTNATAAYFSPFTRAWELALGAMVAVGTPWLLGLTRRLAAPMTWIGLGLIVLSAFLFDAATPYPGWHVAIPVVGTALVIAGGTRAPDFGAERLLGMAPFRWLGRLSYSMYLWHWPILVLAAESAGRTTLPLPQTMGWLVVSLLAAMITYTVVENPVRHARFARRHRAASIGLGVGLIALTFSTVTILFDVHGGDGSVAEGPVVRTTALNKVEQLVASAAKIHSVPSDIDPTLSNPSIGIPPSECWPSVGQTSIPACTYGDPFGTRTMVLYGDSHAGMWFKAINDIAIKARWKLVYLGKGWCPAEMLPFRNPQGWGTPGGVYTACKQWHQFAINRINRLKPNLVIVTQEDDAGPNSTTYDENQWQQGLTDVFRAIKVPNVRFDVIGNIPILPQAGPDCLSENSHDVQHCIAPISEALPPAYASTAEETAVSAVGGQYIDVIPWFCSQVCSPVIGTFGVYFDDFHITTPYSQFLEGVLTQALHLHASASPQVQLLRPADGSTLSGTELFDVGILDKYGVKRVEFRLTGGSLHDATVGVGKQEIFGWADQFDTETVPNGTYTLKAVIDDEGGRTARTPAISVRIQN